MALEKETEGLLEEVVGVSPGEVGTSVLGQYTKGSNDNSLKSL